MTARLATQKDCPIIAEIYNQGIAERIATFETQPRKPSDIIKQLNSDLPIVVIESHSEIIAFAIANAYSNRACYQGIAEFSVYVQQGHRGQGAGKKAMTALITELATRDFHKMVAKIFPENKPSLTLMKQLGFRQVGVHKKHGQLEGVWRDVVVIEKLL